MVSTILAVFSLAGATPKAAEIDVAFNARFYYSDSRHSTFHLYVCALDGSHRRQIRVAQHVWNVHWVDRRHLSWIEGTFRSKKALYISAAPFTSKRLVSKSTRIDYTDKMTSPAGGHIDCDIDGRRYELRAKSPQLRRLKAAGTAEAWTASERVRAAGANAYIELARNGLRRSFRWSNLVC